MKGTEPNVTPPPSLGDVTPINVVLHVTVTAPPSPVSPRGDRRTDTSRQAGSVFRLLCKKKKNSKQTSKKKKSQEEKWQRYDDVGKTYCVSSATLFFTFIWAGRLWHSEISSSHTDENGCVGNENPLWRGNPWHPVLFLFFFFPLFHFVSILVP